MDMDSQGGITPEMWLKTVGDEHSDIVSLRGTVWEREISFPIHLQYCPGLIHAYLFSIIF